jgi:adenylate cyclase
MDLDETEKMKFFTGSIRRKLLLAVTLMLAAGVSAVVWISTNLQVKDSRMFMLKMASDTANNLGMRFRSEVQQTLTRARGWALQVVSLDPSAGQEQLRKLIEGDALIAGVEIYDKESGKTSLSAFQDVWSAMASTDGRLTNIETADDLSYRVLESGNRVLHQATTPLFGSDKGVNRWLVVYLDAKPLQESFRGDGMAQAVLYDSRGQVLLQSQSAGFERMFSEAAVPADLVQASVSSPLSNGQISLRLDGRVFIGSFYKTGVSGTNAAVVVDEERVFDTPRKIATRSAYLGMAILSFALVFAVFFADSMAKPVLQLVNATRAIGEGDFSVRAQPTTNDEIKTLTQSFNDMAAGLAEREKLKTVFGKFHSKAVAEKLMNSEGVRLGGERIPVTVFFSDIRSFTSRSESMAPEEVVEMLNEYMTEMVSVIEKYEGVVDKYVGDAIMAVWGMPTPDPRVDAERAVRACLEMRVKLEELNVRRAARGQAAIAIGMGLNSGEVIAGNIGSQSRMEYTVIGDTVNTASRMESLTKDLKTDFLVNESTYKLLPRGIFDFEEPQQASAKGKADKILVYGVRGYQAVAEEAA